MSPSRSAGAKDRTPRAWCELAHEERCLDQFEDFCIVTQSIRRGIPVTVSVRDAAGETLEKAAAGA